MLRPFDFAVVHPYRMHRLSQAAAAFDEHGTRARARIRAVLVLPTPLLPRLRAVMSLCEENAGRLGYWDPGLAKRKRRC